MVYFCYKMTVNFFVLLFFVGTAWFRDDDPEKIIFKKWKIRYNKTYSTMDEENFRFLVWSKNFLMVEKHNYLHERSREGFSLKLNHLADMTGQEFITRMTIHVNDPWWCPKGAAYLKLSNIDDDIFPESLDWREEGLVTNVKNQGNCASSYAFSAVAVLEGQHARKTGVLRNLSVQNVLDCGDKEHNFGCIGGAPDKVYRTVIREEGISSSKSYPYEGQKSKCRSNKANFGAKVTSFVRLPKANETILKEAVTTVGPISVVINLAPSFQLYNEGVYFEPNCEFKEKTHALVVIGYGMTARGEEYWLVKNSFGARWGEDGYMKIARNQNNHCGIASTASYPLI